ncbi:hypothetical protein GCM10010387_63040 [Streptomyces inusitatus]|uniref:Uncharacterized protein n=1 Tax=Streptomyces inusitatus TaxID=68221 RepID=A0A918QP28_9ACTN|nr:hypothetical protein GCM10010387_63040 [Streptomyces inusitatus]
MAAEPRLRIEIDEPTRSSDRPRSGRELTLYWFEPHLRPLIGPPDLELRHDPYRRPALRGGWKQQRIYETSNRETDVNEDPRRAPGLGTATTVPESLCPKRRPLRARIHPQRLP